MDESKYFGKVKNAEASKSRDKPKETKLSTSIAIMMLKLKAMRRLPRVEAGSHMGPEIDSKSGQKLKN